jgi:hypothetical protein
MVFRRPALCLPTTRGVLRTASRKTRGTGPICYAFKPRFSEIEPLGAPAHTSPGQACRSCPHASRHQPHQNLPAPAPPRPPASHTPTPEQTLNNNTGPAARDCPVRGSVLPRRRRGAAGGAGAVRAHGRAAAADRRNPARRGGPKVSLGEMTHPIPRPAAHQAGLSGSLSQPLARTRHPLPSGTVFLGAARRACPATAPARPHACVRREPPCRRRYIVGHSPTAMFVCFQVR